MSQLKNILKAKQFIRKKLTACNNQQVFQLSMKKKNHSTFEISKCLSRKTPHLTIWSLKSNATAKFSRMKKTSQNY